MAYQPNIALHPGRTVARALAHLGMTQKSLSERTGLTEKHISSIINGEASVTPETAALFANALGGSPSFWNNMQSNYEATRVRLESKKLAESEVTLIANHPYTELAKRNRVARLAPKEKIARVMELWRFYGVNSLKSIQLTESVAFRRGATEQVKAESLAAWLRCGELEAKELSEKIDVQEYNEAKLKALLPKLRSYTKCEEGFWDNLVEDLANVGVILVAAEHFKGTRANGATRWIGGNPVVQLSAYGRNADGVWFSLFHELGHILIHGRKQKFISFQNGKEKSTEEIEADEFASEKLISQKDFDAFIARGDLSRDAIKEFAKVQDVHAGIVVGRLKINGILDFRAHPELHGKLAIR